jgi:HEAT repeat protein
VYFRSAAAEALAKLGDPRAVEPLIRALGDIDSDVRGSAARALAKLGDPRAVEPLVRALGDPILLQQRAWNIVERLAAFNALAQLASAHPSAIGQRWGEIQQRAWNIGLNFPDPPPGLDS